MYSKLFSSLIHSSLWRQPVHVRVLFVSLLSIADSRGFVYGSRRGLEAAANIQYDLSNGDADPWQVLMSPDSDSSDLLRNPKNRGRRIEQVPGGYRILNFLYYRSLRDNEARREQNRRAQAKFKDKVSQGKPRSAKVSQTKPHKPQSAHTEAETEAEAEAVQKKMLSSSVTSESQWIEELTRDSAYEGIDVRREHAKALRWGKENKVQMTRRRFVNWLNRADRKMNAGARADEVPKIDPSKITLPEHFKSWAATSYPEKREVVMKWRTWADVPASLRQQWWREQKNKLPVEI